MTEKRRRATKPEKLQRIKEIIERMVYQPEPYWPTIEWIQETYGVGEKQAQYDYTEAKQVMSEIGQETFRETLDQAIAFWRHMRRDAHIDGDKETAMKSQREESKLLGHYVERQSIDLTGTITFDFGDE